MSHLHIPINVIYNVFAYVFVFSSYTTIIGIGKSEVNFGLPIFIKVFFNTFKFRYIPTFPDLLYK